MTKHVENLDFSLYQIDSVTEIFNLSNKTYLVIGGSSGIGLGMAVGLGKAGASLVLVGRTKDKLETAKKWLLNQNIQVSILSCDVSSDSTISDLDNYIHKNNIILDGVILSAAKFHFDYFLSYQQPIMDDIIALNLKTPLLISQWIGNLLKDRGGSIIFLLSGAAIKAMPKNSIYAATKGALRSLTKTLAVELARYNIRVNSLIPGWVDTPLASFAKGLDKPKSNRESLYYKIERSIPLRRWGLPKDFAGFAIWLMSDSAAYVTGQEFVIDGGLTIV